MPNLINTNDSNNLYMSSRPKEREVSSFDLRNEKKVKAQPLFEDLQHIAKEKKKKESVKNEVPERGDYRQLIDRVAEQEAKKSKLSAFTHGQQELLKQVEKTISPAGVNSYDFKV